MPAPRLTLPPTERIVEAVRAALAGDDITTAAARVNLTRDNLADAIEAYNAAGAIALEQRAANSWHQVRVRPIDPADAERSLTEVVGPRLDYLVESGGATGWWFMRKEPGWRIRLHNADIKTSELLFNDLVASQAIGDWTTAIYEPETAAFGGETGTEVAHTLFQADTSGVLAYLRRKPPALGRRETSLLLISAMLTGADLDWFERGDVFFRVAAMRPSSQVKAMELANLTEQLTGLLATLAAAESPLFTSDGPLASVADWRGAFEDAGQHFADAASSSALTRGLRAVLAQVVIFHWNRFGLSAATQAVLADAAARACISMD
jgi:thiopeptide-type bacteriocin biosynthesis protein